MARMLLSQLRWQELRSIATHQIRCRLTDTFSHCPIDEQALTPGIKGVHGGGAVIQKSLEQLPRVRQFLLSRAIDTQQDETMIEVIVLWQGMDVHLHGDDGASPELIAFSARSRSLSSSSPASATSVPHCAHTSTILILVRTRATANPDSAPPRRREGIGNASNYPMP